MPDPLTTSLAAPAAPAPAVTAPAAPDSSRLARIGAALRTHWFFTLVLAVGLTGRVLTMVAYRPALLYIDSFGYLNNMDALKPTGSQPIGYPLMLKLLLHLGSLTFVVGVQHLLGLAMGVCIYVMMVRHRMPKTLAALAAMPVLLDAYEWEIEQNILTDSLFLVLITAALALLAWRHRPGPWFVAAAGLVLGASVAVRAVGEAMLVPALLFVVLSTGPTWRRRVKVTAAFVVAAALPLIAYSVYAATFSGPAGLRVSNAVMLYGRTATIADCASMPADLKVLCPSGTASDRQKLGPDYYASSGNSPYMQYRQSHGGTTPPQAARFSVYVIEHQPLQFAEAVGHDFFELFISTHGNVSGGTAVARWQFQTQYPEFPPLQAAPELAHFGQSAPAVNTGVAQLLRDYQLGGGYTPNVLYAVFLLAGLGGALGLTRSARRSGLRAKCALYTGTGVVLLLAADMFLFSWRYQLPALVTLSVGGAYGIAALLGFGRMWPPMRAYPEPSDEAAVAGFRERYGADFELAPIVVLIAAYNEADAIGSVIDDLPDECLGMAVKPLIVVDGATDDTARISIEHGAPTCVLPVNRGQGAALRVGYHLAHAGGARYIVTSDGDGQYDAGELPRLLAPLLDDSADLVIGSRVLGGRENRDLVRHAGVRFFGFCVTKLTGTKVTDTSSGWRAMRAQVPVNVRLTQAQYQTSEFLIGALSHGYRVVDVPMSMRLRSHGSTKKGNNLVFGTRYARVVFGTWLREWVWGRTRRRLLARRGTGSSVQA